MTESNNKSVTLSELAEAVGAEVDGDGSVAISGVAPIESAGPGQISFVANRKYEQFIKSTRASALVLAPDVVCDNVPVIRHANPYLTFARLVDILYPKTPKLPPGIHSSAVVAGSAEIAPEAAIGALCVVGERVKVGAGSQIMPSVFLGDDVEIGEGTLIYPGVKIMDGCKVGDNTIIHAGTVIGSDGFGFAESEQGLYKIQQIGWVEIGHHVEIGANTTIDRGAIGPTRIGNGVKIDNLVQIAHNVEIGDHSIVVSQVGISGSTKLGRGCVLAGQVGVVGHLNIGDGVKVGAQSGVTKSFEAGKTVFGSPARDMRVASRIEATMARLPEMLKRLRAVEKKLDEK